MFFFSKPSLILDIGCGTGNITTEIFETLKGDRMIAFDLSEEMIRFAKHEHTAENVQFEAASIDWQWPKLAHALSVEKATADLLVSVHVMHWIADPEKHQTVQNMFSLLRPGGKAYLVFFSWSDLLPLQERMTLTPRWRKYFADLIVGDDSPTGVEKVEPTSDGKSTLAPEFRRRKSSAPFATFDTPTAEKRLKIWRDLCEQIGFNVLKNEIGNLKYDFGHINAFRDELKALCHFLPRIPSEERDEFLADYYAHIDNVYTRRSEETGEVVTEVALNYQNITLVLEKPDQQEDD